MPTNNKSFNQPKKFVTKDEPSDWKSKLIQWTLIVLGVCAIVWMIATNPPQKRLNCSKNSGQTSMLEFGTCSEE